MNVLTVLQVLISLVLQTWNNTVWLLRHLFFWDNVCISNQHNKKTFVFYTFISHDSWEKLSSFESAWKCSLSLSLNQITLILTIQCSTVATFMQHSVPNLKFGLHLYINYWLEDRRQSNNCLVIHYLHEEHNPWYPHSAQENKTSFNGHQHVLVCELIHSCTV